MIFRLCPFVMIFCFSCRTESRITKMRIIAENNKDVVVLSYLIKDYMVKTRRDRFTFEEIVKYDTLGRIKKSFSGIEVGNWPNPWRGGYAVYFKFAAGRNKDSVKLIQNERIPWKLKTKREIGRTDKQRASKFDGEIHFNYPERFYHISETIIKRPKNQ